MGSDSLSSNFRTWNPLIDLIGATSDIQRFQKHVAMGYLSSVLRSATMSKKKGVIQIVLQTAHWRRNDMQRFAGRCVDTFLVLVLLGVGDLPLSD